MAAFPTPAWDDTKIAGYLDALEGAHDRHINAALDRILRGGWRSDFAPVPATVRLLVNEIAAEEAAERRHHADQAKRREETRNVAGPWHAHLWHAWFALEHRLVVTDHLRPYAAIARRHNLTPDDGGCRDLAGPNHGLYTDQAGVTDAYRQAITEAEDVWRQSGSTETAEQAARRALGGMTGHRHT